MRPTNIEESDKEDEMSITEKLRRASAQNPANIPMLVVVGFNPDSKGLQKKQIEIQRGLILLTFDAEELRTFPLSFRFSGKCPIHYERMVIHQNS